MSGPHPILIAGAGIAGLAVAVGLARAGFAVKMLERRRVLSEAGAGIQIGANGVKALAALGLREAVEAVAFKPQGLAIRQGASGALLTRLPWGDLAQRRWGAPYLTMLRSELQAALLAAARAQDNIELVLDFDVADVAAGEAGVAVTAQDGRQAQGRALIGADGLWSRVRDEVQQGDLEPTGYVAYRAVIDRGGLAAPFDAPDIGLWLSAEAHVVHYPVMGGQKLGLVVIVGNARRTDDWDDPAHLADIAPYVAKWAAGLRHLLEHAPSWRRWTLYDLTALRRWSTGAITLMGDAAHPVLPFFAQGAVMALEDAALLVRAIKLHSAQGGGLDVAAAFATYEDMRKNRVRRMSAASWANGRTYHMGGLGAVVRDTVLRLSAPERLLGRFDWLYGYDPGMVAMHEGRR